VIAALMQHSLATPRGLNGRGPVSALHRSVIDVAADGGQRGGSVGAALPAPSDVIATRRPIAVLPPEVVEPSDDAATTPCRWKASGTPLSVLGQRWCTRRLLHNSDAVHETDTTRNVEQRPEHSTIAHREYE
jgi:hypothetical protein